MRIKFEEVSSRVVERGKCVVCGKNVRRVISATHTVNPYNRRADGEPKTRQEVLADVQAEVREKSKGPVYHDKCWPQYRDSLPKAS